MVQRFLKIIVAALAVQLFEVSMSDRSEDIVHQHRRDSIDLFKKRRSHTRNIPDNSICQSRECKAITSMIFNSMKNTTDPCEDFYDYACGGWNDKNILPLSEAIWNRKTIAKLSLEKQLAGLLENGARLDDIMPLKQAKIWYRSCMDLERLEERGILPLKSIITTVGGWPITMEPGEWIPYEFSWQQVEQYYSRFTGSYALYNVNVPSKSQNCLYCNELTMTQPKLPLSEYLPNPRKLISIDDIGAYSRLIARVVKIFVEDNHAHISRHRIVKEVKDIVDFEISLSEIFPESVNYVLVSVGDIQRAYDMEERKSETSKMDFYKLIKNILDIGNIRMNSSQRFNFQYDYFRDLITLLDDTPARTIVNYIHWHFVSHTMSFTNQKMRDLLIDYTMETFGIREKRSRRIQCVKEMQMHHAVAFEYAKKHFSKRRKNDAISVVREIKKGLRAQISESNWMSNDLKLDSMKKVQSMKIMIGHPHWYSNATSIIKFYEGIVVGSDYFDNNLNYWRFAMRKKLQAWKDNDMNSWVIDPLANGPVYVDVANEINLPLVNLQSPLFTRDSPDVVNYAIAGFIIAQQMAHGFDRTGRLFDKNGNITDWPEIMLEAYDKSAECFVEQFDAYTSTDQVAENFTNVTEIGNRTLDENIADSVGIEAAFLAYKLSIIPKDSTDRRLPGLEKYTKEQLFFLILANAMCEVATPQLSVKKIPTDFRSPARLRVIGTMSNSENFAKAFKCQRETFMNPVKKCNLWKNPTDYNSDWNEFDRQIIYNETQQTET